MHKPLISFVIVAYNQQEFIRHAIEAALAQSYSPMEIIISDDCSLDSTFRVIQETVKAHTGSHIIRLNRNNKNIGFGAHLNLCMELVRGELIVIAAGDDISMPARVEKIWDVYRESKGSAMSIYSSRIIIDKNAAQVGLYERPLSPKAVDLEFLWKNNCAGVMGCTQAWHRNVFDVFGPMVEGTINEDRVIPFRAAMLGKIVYIDEPTVYYRRHASNITSRYISKTNQNLYDRAMRKKKLRYFILKNYTKDLQVINELINSEMDYRLRLKDNIQKDVVLTGLEINFLGGNFWQRLNIICEGVTEGVGVIKVMKWLVRLFVPHVYLRVLRKQELRDNISENTSTFS